MNILITGITGFSGSHLAEYLIQLSKKYKIFGTIRGRCRQLGFIDKIKNDLTLLECDLTDYNAVYSTIEDSQPDVIYHLGAQTFVPTSWRAPQETMITNILGTLNLLETVRKSSFSPIIMIAGSSEEYGLVHEDETPIKETNQLRPLSPYAVSKVTQDLLGYQYFKNYGMHLRRTRAFNLIGPRSGGKIVTASFAKQIAKIEKGLHVPILSVGNLEAIRDFNDVRDVVRAYVIATTSLCNDGEVYNIATGWGYSIQEIVDEYQKLSTVPFKLVQDKKRMRPSDVPVLIGDSTKFRNATGWLPEYTFKHSLKDVLEYWRQQA